jgi:hypothetical protein
MVMLLSVGLTKKPLQPTPKANSSKAAIAAPILIFCFVFSILEKVSTPSSAATPAGT